MSSVKNKWVLISVVAVIVMLLGVSYFVFSGKDKISSLEEEVVDEAIKMNPEDIGLTLEATTGNKEVLMKISDTSKFTSFEYEMNYEADVDGEMVSRGAIGSGEVEGDDLIERKITIGTCSSGTCKFDKGVKKVSLVLRLNLKTGETAIVESDLELE